MGQRRTQINAYAVLCVTRAAIFWKLTLSNILCTRSPTSMHVVCTHEGESVLTYATPIHWLYVRILRIIQEWRERERLKTWVWVRTNLLARSNLTSSFFFVKKYSYYSFCNKFRRLLKGNFFPLFIFRRLSDTGSVASSCVSCFCCVNDLARLLVAPKAIQPKGEPKSPAASETAAAAAAG